MEQRGRFKYFRVTVYGPGLAFETKVVDLMQFWLRSSASFCCHTGEQIAKGLISFVCHSGHHPTMTSSVEQHSLIFGALKTTGSGIVCSERGMQQTELH